MVSLLPICGPESVLPSEYLPEICGLESSDADSDFDNLEDLQEFLDLLVRYWNNIVHTLSSGEIFLPMLLEGDDGMCHANDWAWGFMRGVEMRHGAWLKLFNDEEHGGPIIPILVLFHEHDPDPEMRPYEEPVSTERRDELIVGVACCGNDPLQVFCSRSSRGCDGPRRSCAASHAIENRTQ